MFVGGVVRILGSHLVSRHRGLSVELQTAPQLPPSLCGGDLRIVTNPQLDEALAGELLEFRTDARAVVLDSVVVEA